MASVPSYIVTGGLSVPLISALDYNAQSSQASIPGTAALLYNLPASYVSSVYYYTASGALVVPSYDSALRIDMTSTGGGSWDVSDSITGRATIISTFVAGDRGTHEILIGNSRGLGVGDCMPFSCETDTWGGWAPSEGAGSVGIAESSAVGEFDLAEGGVRYTSMSGAVPAEEAGFNAQIFMASVAGSPAPGATTVQYASPVNPAMIGCRYILNSSHTTSAGVVTSVSVDYANERTTVNFSGTNWTSLAVGRYLKIGSNQDLYTVTNVNQLLGDDIFLNGYGVGHWYLISAVNSSTQLVVNGNWSATSFPISAALFPNAPYIVMDGAEIQSFTGNSFDVSPNTNAWSNGDQLYSPPHHYQAMVGINLILQKLFKDDKTVQNAYDGIRLISRGYSPFDYGLRISGLTAGYGGFNTGICMQNMIPAVGVDLSSIHSTTAAIRLAQQEKLLLDAYASAPYICGLTNQGVQVVGQSGQISLYATDAVNSDFLISHPLPGYVKFVDSTLDNWLTNVQGDHVGIGPGGATQLTVTTSSVTVAGKLIVGSQSVDFGTAAPIAGTWVRGSIRYNSAISIGQPNGWRCTVAGTPGTWVAMSNL